MHPTRRLQTLTTHLPMDATSAARIKAHCRKIVAIGRNYVDHVKELNNPQPTAPFFFLKPPTSLHLPSAGPIVRPRGITLHHEVELGLVIGRTLRNVPPQTPFADLSPAIAAYVVAIDLTARNMQEMNKARGLPWTAAKGFDTFCPISEPFSPTRFPDPYDLHLQLDVTRGETVTRQSDGTGLMIFRIPRLLSEISKVMTLEAGDVVLTGTPKGVGPLEGGDRVEVNVWAGGQEVEGVKVGWDVRDDADDEGFEYREG